MRNFGYCAFPDRKIYVLFIRYGSYGLNVGIGNMDDDADLEIIGTYDNHQIQAFKVRCGCASISAKDTTHSHTHTCAHAHTA